MDENDQASADEPRPPPTEVEGLDDTGRLNNDDLHALCAHTAAACAELGAGGSLRLRVIGDDAMASAHETYSGVTGTTDVLTFDLAEDAAGGRELDTDALLCLDEAERRAARHGHPVLHELVLYAVHAALHCLGHDDRDPADADAMHTEEDRVLTAIGIGPVYAPASEPAGEAGS